MQVCGPSGSGDAASCRPRRAVDGGSFAIGRGEVPGLVGESVSGTATLARTLRRLCRPAAGHIGPDGVDLTHLPEWSPRRIRGHPQMVFPDPLASFNPRGTIGAAIATGLAVHDICPRPQRHAEVLRMLGEVGLAAAFASRLPHEMPGGPLQPAAIARALPLVPEFAVADEVVSNLDVSIGPQVLNLPCVIHAACGISPLSITHDLRVRSFLCNRIGLMRAGRLLEIGETTAVFARPRAPYTRKLMPTIEQREEVRV